MFGLGFWEIAIILVVAFLVLGPKKLPDLARTIGKSLRDLRRASEDLRSSIQEPLDEIRKPLEEIRSDLSETVYHVRDEIEREAQAEALPPAPDAASEEARRRVEELYAQAAREDAAGELEGPPAPPALPEAGAAEPAEGEPPVPPSKPLAG
jgi:sec-independent protein translocase protein TatB